MHAEDDTWTQVEMPPKNNKLNTWQHMEHGHNSNFQCPVFYETNDIKKHQLHGKKDRLGSKKETDAFNFPSDVFLYLKHVKQKKIIYSSFEIKTLAIAWHDCKCMMLCSRQK